MKKELLTFAIGVLLMELSSCTSKNNSNNGENTEIKQEEANMDVAEPQDYDEINNEPDYPDGYNEVGTLGTLELERCGQIGDPNFPKCYVGRYGLLNLTPIFQFECYPYSRFGDNDFASLIACAYDNETEEDYSVSVPSTVILEGKTYPVERFQLGNWMESRDAATKYILPRTIKYFNFAGLTHLKEVVLCEGIDTISIRAFWSCRDLENVVIPSTVKKIEGLAFNNCPKLKKIRIPASVEDIEKGAAFIGVSKETVIEVEEGCKAFEGLEASDDLIVKGPYGNKTYSFNPEDLNLVFLKSEDFYKHEY